MISGWKLLVTICTLFAPGPSPEATIIYDNDKRVVQCDLVHGAQQGKQFVEEWQCWDYLKGCDTDLKCEDSVRPVGTIERGADADGKPYKVITLPRREPLMK